MNTTLALIAAAFVLSGTPATPKYETVWLQVKLSPMVWQSEMGSYVLRFGKVEMLPRSQYGQSTLEIKDSGGLVGPEWSTLEISAETLCEE